MMSCMQVLPGAEFDIVKELTIECKKQNLPDDQFVLMKGFGSFDIIFLYSEKTFDIHFITKSGPIRHLLKNNLFFCFPYSQINIKELFIRLSSINFFGISLLKINSMKSELKPYQVEEELAAKLQNDSLLLGTLGWNELILLTHDSDIESLINSLFFATEQDKDPLLIKTYSFLALNYKLLHPIIDEKDFEILTQKLDEDPQLNKVITDKIVPSISVSSEPIHAFEIGTYWRHNNFIVMDLLGKEDTLLTPDDSIDITWSDLISALLIFRYKFKGKILSTNTSFKRSFDERISRSPVEITRPVNKIGYNYEKLKNFFGEKAADDLIHHFNSINGLIQHPLIGDAFIDMARYADYIDSVCDEEEAIKEELFFVRQAAQVMKYGAELRLYGTYSSIEEASGQFTRLSGGVQRALLALESIPMSVFKRLGGSWEGFVIAGDYKFSTANEVINVPPDALFKPKQWWAIYHEIAHVYLYESPEIISPNLQVVNLFLAEKPHKDEWFMLMLESAAEVIGYELGFFGDYDLFLKLVWKYLDSICPLQNRPFPASTYLLRTFFVEIFERVFRDNDCTISFKDEDIIYAALIKHIEKVEIIVERQIREKHFIAAKHCKDFKELYPFAQHLYNEIKDYNMIQDASKLQDVNTERVIDHISKGMVWWQNIESVEPIIYKLIAKNEELKFEESMAAILTLWDYQRSQQNRGMY